MPGGASDRARSRKQAAPKKARAPVAGKRTRAGAAGTGKATSSSAKSARKKTTARRTRSDRGGHLFVVGEEERLERLIDGFGNNRVADLLEVARSQPSRWRQGKEKPGATSRRRLLDIDYVLSRLLQIYPREIAEIWITSFNAHLGGRPIDVLHLKGVTPVIEALDAEAEGAYA